MIPNSFLHITYYSLIYLCNNFNRNSQKTHNLSRSHTFDRSALICLINQECCLSITARINSARDQSVLGCGTGFHPTQLTAQWFTSVRLSSKLSERQVKRGGGPRERGKYFLTELRIPVRWSEWQPRRLMWERVSKCNLQLWREFYDASLWSSASRIAFGWLRTEVGSGKGHTREVQEVHGG